MKKNFLKWIFALCIATIAGANMFAELYYNVKEAGIFWDIEVFDSASLARCINFNSGKWKKEESFFDNFNVYADGLTENSFPSGKICVVCDYNQEKHTSMTVPEKIGGYPVVGVFELDLEDDVKSVTIPKNVLFLGYVSGKNLETIKIQSSELAFLYDKDEKAFEFEKAENPSLSEKSKADLRKAGYKGEFN